MKFGFVDGHRQVWPVRVICAVLGLSASGYYAWRGRPESRRSVANRELTEDIRLIHAESSGCYGSPRIHATLRRHGRRHGRRIGCRSACDRARARGPAAVADLDRRAGQHWRRQPWRVGRVRSRACAPPSLRSEWGTGQDRLRRSPMFRNGPPPTSETPPAPDRPLSSRSPPIGTLTEVDRASHRSTRFGRWWLNRPRHKEFRIETL